jgi:hypothetical protein
LETNDELNKEEYNFLLSGISGKPLKDIKNPI